MSMDKFECKGYGDCCRGLKQKFSNERIEKISQMRALVLVPDPKDVGLPVFDWEAEKIRSCADEAGKYVDLSPLWITVSHKKEAVVISWNLNHDVCPFLHGNRCGIYNDRPTICRCFPVASSGFMDVFLGKGKANVNFSDMCRCWPDNKIETPPEMKIEDMYRFFYGIFGDSYLASLRSDMYTVFVIQIIQGLVNKGKVISIYLDDKQKEKMIRKGIISFADFIEREKIMAKEQLKAELERIDGMARKLVGA
ncbi:MAG: YkgJ family cysteine cluster protein [Candidatus Aenigmarchaeota archaeon]|nr:YkgJ family cysteine cluster protein [Candidatus Aenigmarchaeota archaeon]